MTPHGSPQTVLSKPALPRKVVLLGSGALQIGQAGEFDYSGTQALKALAQEGVSVVLVNPNIATVQTSRKWTSAVYFLPLEPSVVEQIIAVERPDAVLLGFGGQSALNCGLALEETGVLDRFSVRVLGTPIDTIRLCEDRRLFANTLREIGIEVAQGRTVTSVSEAEGVARELGFPLVLRAGFSLGGRGSAVVRRADELVPAVERALLGVGQVLLEESLLGFREIEYELLRDEYDHCIAVCNMENVDPMGIHTGDSIVVAPSQTLTDREYQTLREASFAVIRRLGIVGECNIQFALHPRSGRFVAVEVNPRLSRSSALASKATGYPLAFVAAKLQLGYSLVDVRNEVTKTTTAFFEPALDYVVCKVPRFDLEKFAGVDARIGTEMKSVGEVMAFGRSFPEALQKALRMLEVGADGLDPDVVGSQDIATTLSELSVPTYRRIFLLARALFFGVSVQELCERTGIDRFFLSEMESVIQFRKILLGQTLEAITGPLLLEAKRAGFSDGGLARFFGATEDDVGSLRKALGIIPCLRQVDTLAAEYPAKTNYLYFTYHADESDRCSPDYGSPTDRSFPLHRPARVLLLGSGCYRVGSSVEFDWCGVAGAEAAREAGYEVTLLNCNPETVSTDFDVCERLVFDEVSLETVRELWDFEARWGTGFVGVLGAFSGQTPNRLARPLFRAGIVGLGTHADSIHQAEDRAEFSALCDRLGIAQPRWIEAKPTQDAAQLAAALGGFPVLLRPSYVLSGAAMRVAHDANEGEAFLTKARAVSLEHPVVLSKFETDAIEVEWDGVAQKGEVLCSALCEHLEPAGIHSGDSTMVLPPQTLSSAQIETVQRIAETLVRELQVTGPVNLQCMLQGQQNEDAKVIECNLRASRSLPFVSKAVGIDFARMAARAMLGETPTLDETEASLNHPMKQRSLPYVAVKAPLFSFRRLVGADPLPGVEMAATGEVGCFGVTFFEALAHALLSTGFRFPRRSVLFSLPQKEDVLGVVAEVRVLQRAGLVILATPETADVLASLGVASRVVDICERDADPDADSVRQRLQQESPDCVFGVPSGRRLGGREEGFALRRAAVDLEIPLLTNPNLIKQVLRMLVALGPEGSRRLPVRPWHMYLSLRRG
ncbi:MAG TPA: carbamoyl-phosphate synthase (glutamine-hydrolyzing) large subunit [Pseudomonadota bacterium]|nr:carbamoyl-phosphate synthase (glutamine-hydrolyzing) large subunit [Pseudomonadota bacterium]